MNETTATTAADDQPGLYEIRIGGHLPDRWANWFEGLTITRAANGQTCLTGLVRDQAALYGLLKKVRDLGMPLHAVNRLDPEPAAAVNKA